MAWRRGWVATPVTRYVRWNLAIKLISFLSSWSNSFVKCNEFVAHSQSIFHAVTPSAWNITRSASFIFRWISVNNKRQNDYFCLHSILRNDASALSVHRLVLQFDYFPALLLMICFRLTGGNDVICVTADGWWSVEFNVLPKRLILQPTGNQSGFGLRSAW